jgi:hypothetical protein
MPKAKAQDHLGKAQLTQASPCDLAPYNRRSLQTTLIDKCVGTGCTRPRRSRRYPSTDSGTIAKMDAPSGPGLNDPFEEAIDDALSSLPADLRAAMSNVEILVEDEPRDVLRSANRQGVRALSSNATRIILLATVRVQQVRVPRLTERVRGAWQPR